jgi:ubiquinol-cytochrome c reductase cytochrome b subunit
MVGEIAMYCFVLLIVTGIYLALFYKPSDAIVVYHGPYKPLDGQSMTEAYAVGSTSRSACALAW